MQDILYVCEYAKPTINEVIKQSTVHSHDHYELSIIIEGTASYVVHQKAFTLFPGDFILLGPNVQHSVSLQKQGHYRDLHIGIGSLIDSLNDYLKEVSQGYLVLNYMEEKETFLYLCETLIKETKMRKPDFHSMIEGLTTALQVLTLRLSEKDNTPYNKPSLSLGYPDKSRVVEFITNYINQNYMSDISLEMFAKDMYLSQVYISKIFKEETGSSPINYLIKTRLAMAKELLEEENLPVKIVASQVGYEDAYHFSKLFKKYYGYSPSDIKKANQAK